MFTTKHQVIFFLTLLFCATNLHTSEKKFGLRKNTTQLLKTSLSHSHKALCSIAQGIDHIFYPALYTIAGKHFYEGAIQPYTSNAPKTVLLLEENIPGTNTARNIAVYAVVGALLCSTLNYASNIESVNDFIKTNMPHISALLQHMSTEFASDEN